MVALSMCLTPCSPFLLQQQEQWCWDAGTWLGWMVRQGLPHRNRGLTALSLLLFVQLQLGKAQQLPLPSVLPVCWAHLAERCFCHLSSPPPCSSFWARAGLWGKEVPVVHLTASCSEEGTVEPLPGLVVAPVPCDRARPCPAPPGLCAGGWQLYAHVLHSRQEGRRREAEVLCCSTGAWGRFWAEPSFPLCGAQCTPSELMGLGHTLQ